MSCEYENQKKMPGLTKQMDLCFKKPRKNWFFIQKTTKYCFSSIFCIFKHRALISAPRISKTRGTKVVCNYER
jgi:hypothetical protein